MGSSAGSSAAHGSAGPATGPVSPETTYPVPSSSETASAPMAVSARRTSVTRHPVHHLRSSSVAGPHAVNHRRNSSAWASPGSSSGWSGAGAQRNWLDVHEPSGRPRTTLPSTPSTLSSWVETVCTPS